MKIKLEKISKLEDYDVYRFTPTIFDLFGKYYPEKINLRRIIRFLFALKCGYEIFYVVHNDKTVAYCAVQSGRSKRFDFSGKNDFILGPAYVVEEYRGHSMLGKLITFIVELNKDSCNNIYGYINKNNIASIKIHEKLGVTYCSDAILSPLLCNVKSIADKSGTHFIIMYKGDLA